MFLNMWLCIGLDFSLWISYCLIWWLCYDLRVCLDVLWFVFMLGLNIFICGLFGGLLFVLFCNFKSMFHWVPLLHYLLVVVYLWLHLWLHYNMPILFLLHWLISAYSTTCLYDLPLLFSSQFAWLLLLLLLLLLLFLLLYCILLLFPLCLFVLFLNLHQFALYLFHKLIQTSDPSLPYPPALLHFLLYFPASQIPPPRIAHKPACHPAHKPLAHHFLHHLHLNPEVFPIYLLYAMR